MGQAGFLVAETLTAVSVLAIALMAILIAMNTGIGNVNAARRSTTAVFLAEQRLEQIRTFALSSDSLQGWGNVTAANFPAEDYHTILSYGDYRRSVSVTANPGGATNTKLVEVWVYYRPASATGLSGETGVVLSSLLVSR